MRLENFVCGICGTPHKDLLSRMKCEQSCYAEQVKENEKQIELTKNMNTKFNEIKEIDNEIFCLNKQSAELDRKLKDLYKIRNETVLSCARDYGEYDFIVEGFKDCQLLKNIFDTLRV